MTGEESWLPHDSEGMLRATAALPDHLAGALSVGARGLSRRDPDVVVVLGMGGSSVAGSVLEALARRSGRVPVVTAGGYECPAFVSEKSVVFSVSFSGETEETLFATEAALDRGALTVSLSSGGSLAALVTGRGGVAIELPTGIPQPRAGIAAMVAPLLLSAEEMGIISPVRSVLEGTVVELRRRLGGIVAGGGEASDLARRIGATVPIFHGARGLGAVAARRWKTQVNENAKRPAFSGEQPEVCHNELCGFADEPAATRGAFSLVSLVMPQDDRRVTRRAELFSESVRQAVEEVVEVEAAGESELSCFFDLVALGDVVSLHLAAGAGIDPGPVPMLTSLKAQMADEKP